MSSPHDAPRPSASRFMMEVDALVRAANREAITARIPRISRRDLEALARKTAELRADYLAAAFQTDWTTVDLDSLGLEGKRRMYDESLAAFEALERAIRRGYIDIE